MYDIKLASQCDQLLHEVFLVWRMCDEIESKIICVCAVAVSLIISYLFIYGLFKDSVSSIDYVALDDRIDDLVQDMQGNSRRLVLTYPGVCLEGLSTIKKYLSYYRRFSGRDFNLRCSEHERGQQFYGKNTNRKAYFSLPVPPSFINPVRVSAVAVEYW
jgi:hypothetical protein